MATRRSSRFRWGALAVVSLAVAGSLGFSVPASAADPVGQLALESSASSLIVDADSRVTFTSTITNIGTIDLRDVAVTAFAPSGWVVFDDDGNWRNGQNTFYYSDPLESGESRTFAFRFDSPYTPADGETGTFAFTASSPDATLDPVVTNACPDYPMRACAEVEVIPAPTVTIGNSVDTELAEPGDILNYTITLITADAGPDEEVVVTDLLPEGVTFLTATPMPSSVDTNSGPLGRSTRLTWPAVPNRPEPSVFQVQVSVNPGVTNVFLVNAAHATGASRTNTANPCRDGGSVLPFTAACATTSVGAPVEPGLALSVDACILPSPTLCKPDRDFLWTDSPTLLAGHAAVYRVVARNSGGSPLFQVQVGWSVFGGQRIVRGSLNTLVGTIDGQSWKIGTLEGGQSATLLFRATLPESLGPVSTAIGGSAISGDALTSVSGGDTSAPRSGTKRQFADSLRQAAGTPEARAFVRAWLAAAAR